MRFKNEILSKTGFLGDDYIPDFNSLKKCRDNLKDMIKQLENLSFFMKESKDKELKEDVLNLLKYSFGDNAKETINNISFTVDCLLEEHRRLFNTIESILKQGNNDTNKNLRLLYRLIENIKEDE